MNNNRKSNLVIAAIRAGYRVITEVQVSQYTGTIDITLTQSQVEKYIDHLTTLQNNDTVNATIDNLTKIVVI